MRANKLRHERVHFIDERIRHGMKQLNLCSSAELAEAWKEESGLEKICMKTINRDLDYLRFNRKAPLAYDKQKHGWYYTEPNYFLPAIMLEQSEKFAIYITEKVLKQYAGTPIYEDLRSIFGKIQDSLPKNVIQQTHALSRFSHISPPTTDINLKTWNDIFTTLEDSKKLRMDYKTPGKAIGENTWRDISPYHVINYSGSWYLIGHCHQRDAIRIFNFSRIKDTIPLDEIAKETPEDFSIDDILKSSFGMHFGEFGKKKKKVALRFEKEVAPHVEERKWHQTQETKPVDNGAILFTAEIDDFSELIYWILSWGRYVTVEEPEELRALIKDEAKGIASRYK